MVESERYYNRVEAEVSILRDCGRSKRYYCVYHVWYLDHDNMKDFFEKVWDFQTKNTTLRFVALLHVP